LLAEDQVWLADFEIRQARGGELAGMLRITMRDRTGKDCADCDRSDLP
jgi:hypothetical protein